jgi:HAE1 family hydrophobic/amphiphilic exporter-1
MADVTAAWKTYKWTVSAGQFGGARPVIWPTPNTSIVVQGMLKTPEEFGSIHPGQIRWVLGRIRDVGSVESHLRLDIQSFYNGKPSAAMGVRLASGANALDTADAIKAKLTEMSRFFPHGMKVVYPYDTTPFVKVAIGEVVETLLEAIHLVFLVMWLVMGTYAPPHPTIAVTVVILGTFAVLQFFGFS